MDSEKIFGFLFGFLTSYDSQKKKLFDSHVTPLMEGIEEIHRYESLYRIEKYLKKSYFSF
jgi:hypothetical protein